MNQRRTVIITGASSGIGMALAERTVRAGYNVFAVGRRMERLVALSRIVEAALGKIAVLAIDVTEPHAAETIVRGALERFGRIDILVNNAGGVAVGPIAEQSDAALREQTETHVIAPLALTREALPALRANRGHIFFVGSGVARIPVGMLGAYPPVKAAVRNMTRIVRNELRADGIAVTYVDPGAVATEFMTRAGFAGPPPELAASPYDVARRIFAAFTSRASVVNGVPWQTTIVAIAEALPALTDAILRRAPQIVLGDQPMRLPVREPYGVPPPPPRPRAEPVLPVVSPAPIPAAIPEPVPQSLIDIPPLPKKFSWVVEAEAEAAKAAAEASETIEHHTPAATNGVPIQPPMSVALAGVPNRTPPAVTGNDPVETALASQLGRMRKLNLGMPYVRGLLVPGRELDPADVALGWAGMPNKNERALTNDVLSALADAGLIEHIEPEKYRVR